MVKIISIVGITSSGKSGLALDLAKFFDGEIVSADSRQIYRKMNYCTGKETVEELASVPHHLIDIIDTNELFNLADYQKRAYAAIDDIAKRHKLPILCGGTGLYVRSVVEGYNLSEAGIEEDKRNELLHLSRDELLAILAKHGITDVDKQKSIRHLVRMIEKAEVGDTKEKPNKPKYDVLQIGIKWTRQEIYDRIEKRLDQRLPHIVEEVKSLLESGTSREFMNRMGLEAKMATEYIDGKFESFEHFRNELLKEERHFAKRQDTWFKKDVNTIWLDGNSNYTEQAKRLIQKFLEK